MDVSTTPYLCRDPPITKSPPTGSKVAGDSSYIYTYYLFSTPLYGTVRTPRGLSCYILHRDAVGRTLKIGTLAMGIMV